MAEPATAAATTISLKYVLMALGSAIGSATSLVFSPAKNHLDAAIKFGICFAFTMTAAPIATRAAARQFDASSESIPDLTLFIASVLGICSWSLVAALHKGAAKHSDRVAEEGFAAALPKSLLSRLSPKTPQSPS